MIPRRLVRTVPQHTGEHTEKLWQIATAMHPDWQHVTLRDPIERAGFPISAPFWDDCATGAQLADLIRIEDLLHNGGWYIDSDVLMCKPLDTLCGLSAVAAWEDERHVPNAVLGFAPGHPALAEILRLAIARQDQGTWAAGVGVCTEVLTGRDDVTLLPPGAFYPVHWRTAHASAQDWGEVVRRNPWAYAAHQYAASWH